MGGSSDCVVSIIQFINAEICDWIVRDNLKVKNQSEQNLHNHGIGTHPLPSQWWEAELAYLA